MNATATPVNRHPVDELADVRAQIKELQEKEYTLRVEVSVLMGDNDSLGGDEFIAKQILSNRAGAIDTKALEKAGIDIDKYRKPSTVVYQIRCERRVLEDA